MGQMLANPQIVVIRPQGSLNATKALDFEQQLTTAIEQRHCSILLVDFKQVESLDSAGLMALIAALKKAQSLSRRLSVCCVSPTIKLIFELTQLERAFEIFECQSEFTRTYGLKL
ncbi:MAG: anti-sigma factor antagonist [Brasilonema octagenarum HA4186-MV1]|jgi:anti-anti-sigma factor|uniref:Anti-sigma factor antagonist n=1 Tax=Brasilonema sennae CENA114 TaxID=415709 RepID=A0A856M812_9CYAN|nr:STAS domain-containing protein [Brasilonema sennae]MBW4628499.1 anti-sigma factor antagonist [Brasilonema octagenarum HA4186-MV1]QDL06948.1 anti-anti-sigma factor [Brasilonema sennae CENA114]QDL13311.1 anti-anti-sigma factor [Brasilonema octagenarum UFV-E1]